MTFNILTELPKLNSGNRPPGPGACARPPETRVPVAPGNALRLLVLPSRQRVGDAVDGLALARVHGATLVTGLAGDDLIRAALLHLARSISVAEELPADGDEVGLPAGQYALRHLRRVDAPHGDDRYGHFPLDRRRQVRVRAHRHVACRAAK